MAGQNKRYINVKLLVILLRYSKSQNKNKFKIKSAYGRSISFTKMKKPKDDSKFFRWDQRRRTF